MSLTRSTIAPDLPVIAQQRRPTAHKPRMQFMPLDPALRQQIAACVEQGFAEQIAFTQEMVRFQSTRGNEHALQDFVFRALRDRGYAMDRFEMDQEAIERHPGGAAFT